MVVVASMEAVLSMSTAQFELGAKRATAVVQQMEKGITAKLDAVGNALKGFLAFEVVNKGLGAANRVMDSLIANRKEQGGELGKAADKVDSAFQRAADSVANRILPDMERIAAAFNRLTGGDEGEGKFWEGFGKGFVDSFPSAKAALSAAANISERFSPPPEPLSAEKRDMIARTLFARPDDFAAIAARKASVDRAVIGRLFLPDGKNQFGPFEAMAKSQRMHEEFQRRLGGNLFFAEPKGKDQFPGLASAVVKGSREAANIEALAMAGKKEKTQEDIKKATQGTEKGLDQLNKDGIQVKNLQVANIA